MMNFRVAPILPTSFGSHGDLPVLTKRTIWYLLQSPPCPCKLSPSNKLTLLKIGQWLLWVAQLPTSLPRARHPMMSNTSTIKCRSIMTSKLVRLPDMISWRSRFRIQPSSRTNGWLAYLQNIRISDYGINAANRYVWELFKLLFCLWCNFSMLMLKALCVGCWKNQDFSSFNWSPSQIFCSELCFERSIADTSDV
jgi:hypothetical protein